MKSNSASSRDAGKRQVVLVRLARLVSGGQTGADRAALDFALERGIPHGGWCPQGRLAEDGEIGAHYILQETPASYSTQRTEWNVRDSDGTVIFSISTRLTGGSRTTAEFAEALCKPWLHLSKERDGANSAGRLRRFVEQNRIRVLNVAGPRASTEPAIGKFVRDALRRAIEPGEPIRDLHA